MRSSVTLLVSPKIKIFSDRQIFSQLNQCNLVRKVLWMFPCDMELPTAAWRWHRQNVADFVVMCVGMQYRFNSITILLAMAFERYIYVCWGTAAKTILTLRRRKVAYAILTVASVLISSFYALEDIPGE